MKILLLGNLAVNYRSVTIIFYLLEKNIRFHWLDRSYFIVKINKNNFISKLYRKVFNYLFDIIYFFVELVFILRSDVVFILAMNHDSLLRFFVIKIFNKKLITDYYVSLYDTYVLDRRTVKTKSIKAKLLKYSDRLAITLSDKIIFLNENEKKYYSNLAGVNENEIRSIIIPLYVPNQGKAKLPYLNNNAEKPTICWWGTFLNLHGVENILGAIKLLKERNFEANFYLFGVDNNKAKYYQTYIDENTLREYVFLRTDLTFTNGLVEFLLENCDLALGNFGTIERAKNLLINKILDASAMGIPVLSIVNRAVKEFFNEDKIFLISSNPTDIADSIEQVLKYKKNTIRAAQKAHEIYLQNFTKEKYFKKLHELFEAI